MFEACAISDVLFTLRVVERRLWLKLYQLYGNATLLLVNLTILIFVLITYLSLADPSSRDLPTIKH